jgi:2-keto-3-deoxy-L-fuconate dehydrogenase
MPTLPPLVVLFNAAGFVHHGTILDCNEADWDFSFDLNVPLDVPRDPRRAAGDARARRRLDHQRGLGRGQRQGRAEPLRVRDDEAAVVGPHKSIAADFITRGIRCNAICPGTVDIAVAGCGASRRRLKRADRRRSRCTPRSSPANPWAASAVRRRSPRLAVYLASDESAFTTGTVQISDGGLSN